MFIRSIILSGLLLFMSQTAWAQTKPAQQKPEKPTALPTKPVTNPNPESQVTTTAFGDWALRCQRISDNVRQTCEVSLTIQEKDQPAPIAKIAIGRPVPNENIHVLVLLPNNISFPSSVQVRGDDKDVWSIDIPWQRCVPGACFAETKLKDSDLVRWKTLDNAGKLTFKDAQNNEIGINFSFHGLGQALDALAQQSQ
jgi:invasion protein IalB